MKAYLYNIRIDVPPFVKEQEDSLNWLAEAFTRNHPRKPFEEFRNIFFRVGAKPPQVESRRHYLPENLLQDTSANLDSRMNFFSETSAGIFKNLFDQTDDFDELIHVTCTGYSSPSAAQKWVASSGHSERIRVHHVYHMGCYAALPAVTLAVRACQSQKIVEIGHTELCTLHLDPSLAGLENIVVTSLFADGACAYRLSLEPPQGSALKFQDSYEEIIPDSTEAMEWNLGSRNFGMVLSKDIPSIVKKSLPGILKRWLKDNSRWKNPSLIWAIHPGGPKIIDEIKEAFALTEKQVSYSREILRRRGNMSSATLPHIWNEILKDSVPHGTSVLTMAFGPGLTVSLALLEVHR